MCPDEPLRAPKKISEREGNIVQKRERNWQTSPIKKRRALWVDDFSYIIFGRKHRRQTVVTITWHMISTSKNWYINHVFSDDAIRLSLKVFTLKNTRSRSNCHKVSMKKLIWRSCLFELHHLAAHKTLCSQQTKRKRKSACQKEAVFDYLH